MDEKKQNFIMHLRELKRRMTFVVLFFIVAFGISYFFSEKIYDFLIQPLKEAYEAENRADSHHMIYTNLTEAFFTYLKLANFAAFAVTFPFLLTQIYAFLSPGLYENEKKVLLPYFVATPVLFLLGAMLVYYYIFPAAWKFFIGFEVTANIKLEARVSEYLSLVTQLILAFGIAFQLPVLLTLLVRVEIINSRWLINKRKFAIIIIFIIAAILTPPDVISQIGLAIPMLLLYELSVFASKLIEKGQKKND